MIKIAILGYGNLGKGSEIAIRKTDDMELFSVFTRRDPESIKTVYEETKVLNVKELEKHKDDIDVLIICGGSATDLPKQTPEYARSFNVIDSFDNHNNIPDHFKNVDQAAASSGHLALISCGWDPGLFSIMRNIFDSILPDGKTETFWGKGVSQGHSDAIRRIEGVKDARQYTVPIEEALDAVRNGEEKELSQREKHARVCYVVAEDGADKNKIEEGIKTMPNYFEPYDTTVHFIDQETMDRDHSGLPHGGFVIRNGKTGREDEMRQTMEFSLKLESNPEFTSSVLVAYARAVYKMKEEGRTGAISVLDVAPGLLSPKSRGDLIKNI